ncbi:MAG TPA: Rho termination factor N-terminal domain-containing protein, partial [bacterium]|nr:Rho termination factor N-terminal domain-containing protein [bacterium]
MADPPAPVMNDDRNSYYAHKAPDPGLPKDNDIEEPVITRKPALAVAVLKRNTISELTRMAQEMGLESYSGLRKQELIYRILQH